MDEGALAAGREPAAVRRLYNIDGTFGSSGSGFLQGSTDDWVEQLTGLALTEGISGFILSADAGTAAAVSSVQRFAQEVAPAVRDVVEHERTPGPAERTPGAAVAPVAPEAVAPARTPGPAAAPVAPEAESAGHGLTPTPDDGHRFSAVTVWDESTRPVGPGDAGDVVYSATGRTDGQHLIDVHDHLRAEMA